MRTRLTVTFLRILPVLCSHVIYLVLNPLNAELNPICHLLALLGAHHILHINRIRVKIDLLEYFIWIRKHVTRTCDERFS